MTKETFDRLKLELKELNERRRKLEIFLDEEEAGEHNILFVHEYILMKKQKQCMDEYSNILSARINLHSDDNLD